jgi:hypothetical protein
MTTNPAETVDTSWKGLYRWGGISALVAGIIYLIGIALSFSLGAVPSGGEAILKYLAGHTTLAYAFFGLSILADFLLVPVALALYLALKGINKSAMLAATGFGGLYLVLDLGGTLITWVALTTLSQNYAAATSDIQRAAYVVTANYAAALISASSNVYSSVLSSIWGIIGSLVMLKGIFSRVTAYLGVAVSIMGFVYAASIFVPALANVIAIWLGLFVVWLVLVGSRLYRLGRR